MNKPYTKIDWIRPEIRQLTAYHVPVASNMVKLDAMENPYHWETKLVDQWLEHLRKAHVNRYPDATAKQLKERLREVWHIDESKSLILGNGSDELIQMLILTFNGDNRVLVAPEPSFVMYRATAQVVGMEYVSVPLQSDDFNLDMFAVIEVIENYQPALIFLASPNNPTGNAFALEDIEVILEASPGIVVIDEAYAPFASENLLSRLDEYPNLIIMRTLSKLGLAGLRVGVLIGHEQWLGQIDKARSPYNINVLSQLTATFALQHYAVLEEQIQQIKIDRSDVLQHLHHLSGVHPWPSQANFILFRVADADGVFEGLKDQGILVKNLNGSHPLLEDCLRVTIGTPAENQAFLQALATLI